MVTVTAAPTTTAQNLAAQTTTSAEEDCSSKSKTKTKTKAKTTKTTAAVDSTSTSPAVLVATSVCVPTTVTATQMVTVTVGASTTAAATTTTAAENVATTAATTTSSGALPVNTAAHTGSLTFGTCTDPSVIFGPSFEGRQATDFSFLPNNRVQFNHDSAENPDIVFQAICDTLVNNCGLTETDPNVLACRAAEAAADQFGKTGKAADSFNAALGFATDFASLDSQLPASASTPITPSRTKRRSTGRTMRSNPKIVLKEMVNLARRTGVSRPAIARNADMTVRDDAAVGVAGIAEDFTPDW
ncbi:hypothetical protein DL93DRAFT_2088403 [Clavulina sp. PMI_390]|nr:hypothetical protein DL93DRAFT_2088403 [Clavulina sp. PMI_390]